MGRVGYLAVGERYGRTLMLTDPKRPPRAQLLERCGRKHADKVYVDTKAGLGVHVGYVVDSEWWTIYEVHPWTQTAKDASRRTEEP